MKTIVLSAHAGYALSSTTPNGRGIVKKEALLNGELEDLFTVSVFQLSVYSITAPFRTEYLSLI